jgi:SsrA-binding protein
MVFPTLHFATLHCALLFIMKILNKKAKFNYILFERYEAGVSLLGAEVKAIRRNRADISNSFARIINSEVYLINANIPTDTPNANPTRTRKLLLHKNQITALKTKIKANKLTLVPTKLYNKGSFVKVEIALAKTKREFEKRESLKRKDIEREIEKELRGNKE